MPGKTCDDELFNPLRDSSLLALLSLLLRESSLQSLIIIIQFFPSLEGDIFLLCRLISGCKPLAVNKKV